MSLILPPANSPLRDLFCMSDIAALPDAVMHGKLMSLEWTIINAFGSNLGGDDVASINVLARAIEIEIGKRAGKVGSRHPTGVKWRNDGIEACAGIADTYGMDFAARDMRALKTKE